MVVLIDKTPTARRPCLSDPRSLSCAGGIPRRTDVAPYPAAGPAQSKAPV
jgi:hypothetical protein